MQIAGLQPGARLAIYRKVGDENLPLAAVGARPEDVVRLNDLLHSQEVRDFMEERWQGIVIPVGVVEE